MAGYFNVFLYLVAFGTGVRALWASRNNRTMFLLIFISSIAAVYKVVLYVEYIITVAWLRWDFHWATANCLTALFFIVFHLYRIRKPT